MATRIVKRSSVYHLLNTIAPINHKLKAELDTFGSIFIIGLVLGTVLFVAYLVQ